MVRLDTSIFLLLVSNFLHCYSARGIFDPCYFWSGAVYAGDGKCFLYVDNPMKFQHAREACETEGASLAEIRSVRQRDSASTAITSISGSRAVWLGASLLDGDFRWVSDGDLVSVPLNWWSGSVMPQVNIDDLCLVMTDASTLNVQKCVQPSGYICEIYAGNPCDTFIRGAEYYQNSCFLTFVTEASFDVAVEQCQKRYMFVMEPSTTDLVSFVNKLLEWYNLDTTKPSWLGLVQNVITADITWRTSGNPISEVNWSSDGALDNVTLTSGDALVMNGNESWSLRVVSRSSLAQVVCQRDLSDECAGLFVEDKCLVYHEEQKIWSDAKAACLASNGSYLAEPSTELLSRSIDRYLLGSPVSVYLGGQDIDTPGRFIWDHSRQWLDEGFTNWNANEPNDHGGEENVIHWSTQNQQWNDIFQTTPYAYLCERVVGPIYIHSYVVVIPKEGWAGPHGCTDAMLSVSTQPDHETHNSIEISTFPSGQLKTRTLSGDETLQYEIDINGITLNSSGVQHKYVLVKSQAPLDVLFTYRGVTRYASVTLVFESLPGGESSAFFSNPSLLYNTIGFVSTDQMSASVRLSLSTNNVTVDFVFNGNEVSTRDNLQISASLPEQYQSMYVDSLTGVATSALVHSTGPLSVFYNGREQRSDSTDVTIDQMLPVSLLDKDYVTFPTLPMTSNVIDYYTVVAAYSNTIISVFHPNSSTVLREATLLWPGDSTELQLPASGFHHVTGTEPFYLYAKLTGADPTSSERIGRCSLTLLHEGLFRSSYKLPVVDPLTDASYMFVVIVVRTSDNQNVELVSPDGSTHKPDMCQVVSASQWSGCYFEVTSTATSGAATVYRVLMNSDSPSGFAAYLFARLPSPEKLLCFQLGLPELSSANVGERYDLNSYLSIINRKSLCDVTAPTSAPADVTQCPATPNTTEVTLTSAELEEALEQITAQLTIEKSSLSSVRRTKESAPDERASSSSMGYFSLTFIGVFLGLMIVSDFGKLFLDLKLMVKNVGILR